MKKRYWFGLGLLTLAGAGAVMLPRLVSVEKAKALVAAEVKKHTGRDLVMAGPASVSFFPMVAIRLEAVSLSSPEGFGKDPMLDIPVLTTSFAPLPLLKGQLQLQDFTLEKPTVRLQKLANDKANWEFESQTTEKVEEAAESESASADQSATEQLKKLQLGDLKIQDATLIYQDKSTGIDEQLTHVNLLVEAPDLTEALSVDLSTHYRNKEVTLTLDSGSPVALLQGGKLPLTLEATLPSGRSEFKGDVILAEGEPRAAGNFSLKISDLPALLGWLDPKAKPSEDLPKSIELTSQLQADAKQARFGELKINSDALNVSGQLLANWSKARPAIEGDLTLPEIKIDAFLPEEASPQALLSFISEAYAQEKVMAPAEPWDNSPIDLAFLQAVDAKLNLMADKLHYKGLTVEKAPIKTDLKAGKLNLNLPEWKIASGIVNLKANLDASRPQASWNLNGTLANVEAEPLLKELADYDKLSGKTNASFQLASNGRSVQQWMQGMGGKASFRFNDGAIKGIDLANIARNLKGAFDPTQSTDMSRQKTDFAELSADFTVNDGTAHTDNLLMLAPFARLSGKGDVYLPRKELRFEVTPKAVGTMKGQGGDVDASGLYVPFVVKGTFEQVAFYPKVGDLLKEGLKNPEKLKDLGDNVKDLKKNLKDMFGGF